MVGHGLFSAQMLNQSGPGRKLVALEKLTEKSHMSYNKAMKHHRSPRKWKVTQGQRSGRTQSTIICSSLGRNERRGIPQYGGEYYQTTSEKEMAKDWLIWDDETEKMLSNNPNLVIIGRRPDREALIQKYFPDGNYQS